MSAGATTAPPRPHLVLNVAVVGARKLPEDKHGLDALEKMLREVLALLHESLIALEPGASERYELARHYAAVSPTLRLVSGLADGADQLMATLLDDVETKGARHELAAVLAFDRTTYRDKSAIANKETFDRLIGKCRWVHELDGRYPEGDRNAPVAKRCRARAYRAQGDILLRQCDVLVAISDPAEAGRAGGTHETLRAGLALHVPIIHVSTADANVRLVETHADLDELQFRGPTQDWRAQVEAMLTEMLAEPYRVQESSEAAALDGGVPGHDETPVQQRLLEAYFAPSVPKEIYLHRVWRWVESRLKQPMPPPVSDSEIPELRPYRVRARDLSAYYSGMYRGAFVLNYVLAVIAVILAVASMLFALWPLLLETGTSATAAGHWPPPWAVAVLIVLAFLKLSIVLTIFFTTELANEGHWNEKAVEFRYLAERLRAMNYLPALGVLRAPAPSATQSTTRRVQQTVADWLALAVMRQTDLAGGTRRIDPLQALGAIEERWLQNQIAYHRTTALKMKRMSTFLEGAANWLSAFVIAFVLVDLLLVAAGLVFDDWFGKKVHELSPFYLFLAAIMPAAIAGANGIRFQSESDRLWERSKVFAAILNEMRDDTASLRKDIDSARGSEDPGSWVSAAALNAESCAQLFLDEVAEWSVLYAKELRHA